jgi:hypothetical protein
MAPAANRARRERIDNALFVVASIEALPAELDGAADRVTVLFPWGSLLEAVTRPDVSALARIARLGATLDVVVNRSALPIGTEQLAARYRTAVRQLDWVAHSPFHTTWGRRVMHGRDALHLRARFSR